MSRAALDRYEPARSQVPWWLHPGTALALIVPVTVYVALALSDGQYRDLYREPKHFDRAGAEVVLLAALVLATAATVVTVPRQRAPGPGAMEGEAVAPVLRRCASALFWVTALGYAAWTASGVLHGARLGEVVQAFSSQEDYSGAFKAQFATVPGLTTLTQVGIAFEIVALHCLRRRRDARLVVQLVVLYLLAVLRAYLLTERLALIELAAPLVAVLATGAFRHRGPTGRAVVRVLPVFFFPVLLVVFAAFEYSRSWVFFRTRTSLSFWHFMLLRLGGYYATSYNNGQVQMAHGTWPGRLPDQSLAAFWSAPVIGSLDLYGRFSAPAPPHATDLLERYTSPEFNNPGGFTTPFVDFGTFGALVFFAVAGVAIGLAYRSLRDGRIAGSLFYPVLLTGLSDLPREVYWTLGRALPAYVALAVCAWALQRAHRRATEQADHASRLALWAQSRPPDRALAGAAAARHVQPGPLDAAG